MSDDNIIYLPWVEHRKDEGYMTDGGIEIEFDLDEEFDYVEIIRDRVTGSFIFDHNLLDIEDMFDMLGKAIEACPTE